ncbi:MAG: hypothetical protein Crog4KO_28730 [Crocinitomicaceae bacterium]
MEKTLHLKPELNSLESLLKVLKGNSSYTSSIEYDVWEMRTGSDGDMEQCVLVKKSSMHGVKAYFTAPNTIKISQVIPSKTKNAMLGQSKARRNALELVVGSIKSAIVKSSQQKAFKELQTVFDAVSIQSK